MVGEKELLQQTLSSIFQSFKFPYVSQFVNTAKKKYHVTSKDRAMTHIIQQDGQSVCTFISVPASY